MSGRPDTDHVSRRPCVSVAVVCLYVGVVIGTARACPQRFLTSPNGTVESPGFPDTLKEKVRCKWTISAEPGYVILFTFDVWEVGLETDVSLPCDSNGVTAFVNMYDGETTADIKLLGRYCARKRKPGIITTTGNHLTVVFTIRNTVRNVDWVDIPVHKFNASYTSRKSDDPPEEQIGLFAYGPNADDVKLGENMSLSEPIDLSMEGPSIIPVHAGIPVGDVRANRAQVHADGRVSFYGEDETTTARNYVCVYCTQIDHSAHDAGVWYNTQVSCADPQNTERCEKANADVKVYADDDTFKAHVALVATWQNVEHGKRHHVGEATFQVAVVSNFSVTYAMVYYKSGAMGWQKGAVSATDIHTGTALFSNGTTLFHHMMYSNTTEVLFLDLLKGNTGRRGTYLYKLGDVSSSPEDECRSWYQRNKNLSAERERGFAKLPDCPCTDWRIEGNGDWVHSPTRERSRGDCYRLSKAKSRYLLPYGKLCCYENGRLLLDTRDAGSCTAYNPAYPSLYADYLREDKLAHRACCDRTSSTELCDAFYELRPKGQCVDRTLFRSSWLFGDPHIVTLDEKDYVFNGWGEYTMVTLNTTDVNFVLQGRTDLAETENGTLTNATVFTAFGAEENGVGVFVGLDAGNKSSLVLYADGTDYSVQFRNNRDFFVDSEHFQLAKDNDDLYISFPSWAHIGVSMRFKSLAVSVSLPLTFQGQTQGLLGNFNREKEDDMALPDGTVLPNNLTERQIFEQLGKKWQVSESDSVMRYGPREGPANYTHPDFYPIFLDEQPADVIQEAEAACVSSNLACIYDYVATGSSTFALDSKQVKIEAEETNTLIKNTVPHVQVPATLNVTSGAEVTFTLQGHDPDTNDLVTYHVEDDGNGTVQIDSQTGLVTFTPDALQPSVFRFFVKDSHNVQSPARSPIIIMCSGCSGHGSCDYSRYSFTDRGNYNFQFAACVCEPAWDGPDCESDRDACAGSPCLEQQTCTDLTPDQQGSRSVGYDCGPCPEGYSTDPVSQNCVDVDECLELTTNSCEMGCFNTEGSYECACDAGYRLDSNGHTCWDVNECQEKTDNCEQICSNTLGGYVCLCEEGYTLDDSAATCSQKEDSVSLCRNAGCSHGCRKLADQSSADSVPECFCRPGYDLDLTDNKTCWDHDECRDGVCSQRCYNFVGGFACYCHNGYRLSDDGRTCDPCPPMRYGPDCQLTCTCGGRGRGCHPVRGCVCEDGWTGVYCEEDVDECSQIPSVCGDDQLCTNTRGSYTCSCLDGYRLNLTQTCEDIDECEEDSVLNTCDSLEQCMNVPGSFYCECSGGYRRANNTCADIDECASNKNDCEQICVNVPGTYNCGCYYGYRLNTDRVTCSLVSDVCKEQGLNCTHGCTLSDVSDRAVCFCRTGYQLGGDLQTCVDIDECTAGTSGCSHTCSNTDGGFLCSCPLGMKLDNDGETCLDCPTGTYGKGCTDTCACGLGSDRCDVTSGCVCKSGWQGDSCDTDVNECGSTSVQQECQNMNARCVNYPGGYMCQCQDGYTNSSAGVCQGHKFDVMRNWMPRKRRQRLTLPRKGSRATQPCHKAKDEETLVCPDDLTYEPPLPEPVWSWSHFLLGVSEEGVCPPEEFPEEREDCDGGRAQAFLVVIGGQAIPYCPEEVKDLDKYAERLTRNKHLRHLNQVKAQLRSHDLGEFSVVNSSDDTICLAAHYSGNSILGLKCALTVFDNFTMAVQIHADVLPSNHPFWTSAPCRGNSVSAILMTLKKLSSWKICQGNPDEKMQRLVPVRAAFSDSSGKCVGFREPNVGAQYTSTVRSSKCGMLTSPDDKKARCRACAVFRKTLLKRVSKCPPAAQLSSRTSHANMTREELCRKLDEGRHERVSLQRELEKTRNSVYREIKTKGHRLNETDSSDLLQVLKDSEGHIQEQLPEDALPRVFLEQQLRYHKLEKKNGMRWHPMVIRWCLYLRHKSAAAYDALTKSGFVALPSSRTLYDYSSVLPSKAGFQPETLMHLRMEAGRAGMFRNKWNNYVGILQDEIHVSQGLVYNKHSGELIGFTNLEGAAEELNDFKKDSGRSGSELATHILVLMVRGATSSLKYPFVAFPTRGITADFLYPIVWEAIRLLETECSLRVLYVTCDGASANRRFFKLHQLDNEKYTYWCWNMYANPCRKLYFVSDVPHLVKTTRNCFSNSQCHARSRSLWKDGSDMSWGHIVRLYTDHCQNNIFTQAHKLTNNHIHLTAYSKMKVNYAAQVLSATVASALEQNYGNEVAETVRFIRHMDKFFDCLNTRNLREATEKRNPNLAEYRHPDDPRLRYLLEDFLGYFNEWERSVNDRLNFSKQEKNKMMLSHQTVAGLHISVNSIVEMIKFLLAEGAPFVLTHHFNQDPLEEHFSHCRQKGGANNNPTVSDVLKSSSKLRIIGSSAIAPVTGNITNHRTGLQVLDNTPLPKKR